MSSPSRAEVVATIEARLAAELGTLGLDRPAPIVLAYPSPYRVGMSSLGFQTLYRRLNEQGPGCHRAFLPDEWEPQALPWPAPRQAILSYEQRRPISDYEVIAISVAYELEVAGLVRLLEGAGIPVLASQRRVRDPIVVAGGPLTTTNPSALLPLVDVLIAGEGEERLPQALERLAATSRNTSREGRLSRLEGLPNTVLGEISPGHFSPLPTSARAPKEDLPAYSAIVTPHTELADMFLVEPERGCSRQCTFCVMRGPATGGMRWLPIERPLGLVPDHAKRVGLVGAAVTDHPQLDALIAGIVEQGRGVGVSSLRADRLTPQLVSNLASGGYRQITVASDGISERLRGTLIRHIREESLLRAATLVRDEPRLRGLKVYQMIGAPGETEADVDELIGFARELARLTRLTLTFSTFVAKRNTPLDGQPFMGVKPAEQRLRRIRRGLAGVAQMRPQSPRWAHIEYLLAQRGPEGGYAAIEAVHAGGRYRDWVAAFDRQPVHPRALVFGDEAALARRKGKAAGRRHPKLIPL